MSREWIVLVSAVALVAASSRLASAQDSPASPRAEAAAADQSSQKLNLGVWMGGGRDGRINHMSSELPSLYEPDNSDGQIGIGASFSRLSKRVSLGGDLQSGLRIDSATQRAWSSDQRGSFDLALSLTRHLRVEARQLVKSASLNPLVDVPRTAGNPALVGIGGLELPFAVRQALTSNTGTILTYAFSQRSSIVVTNAFTYSQADVAGGAQQSQSAGARFERRVTRYQTLRLGYRLGSSTFDPTSSRYLKAHDIDVGIDYRRRLPFSSRTTVSGSFGPSMISERNRQSFRMIADASLTQTLARAWQARVDFNRSMGMIEGVTAPLFSTSIAGSVTGDFGRRNSLIATVGYFDGSVSLDQSNGTTVGSRTAALRWRTALTRRVALNAETFYGRLRFGPQVTILSGVPRDAGHLGVRAFVSYWRPVFRG